MTNQQITQYTVAVIIVPFLNMVLRKYIEPKLPEAKKIILYSKKFLLFNLLYTFPVVILVCFMESSRPVDKFFVFGIIAVFATLMFNFVSAFILRQLKISKRHKKIYELHFQQLKEQTTLNEASVQTFKKLLEYTESQEQLNARYEARINRLEKVMKYA